MGPSQPFMFMLPALTSQHTICWLYLNVCIQIANKLGNLKKKKPSLLLLADTLSMKWTRLEAAGVFLFVLSSGSSRPPYQTSAGILPHCQHTDHPFLWHSFLGNHIRIGILAAAFLWIWQLAAQLFPTFQLGAVSWSLLTASAVFSYAALQGLCTEYWQHVPPGLWLLLGSPVLNHGLKMTMKQGPG
jgi:hypothetical protein